MTRKAKTLSAEEIKFVPYSASSMFELVLAVKEYDKFLPWCLASRIKVPCDYQQNQGVFQAELLVGYQSINARFNSEVRFDRNLSTINCQKPPYDHGALANLTSSWRFIPQDAHSCMIEFSVSLSFQSLLLSMSFSPLFDKAISKMVDAFMARAEKMST